MLGFGQEIECQTMLPRFSAHAERFRCIGTACEDTCCRGWNVPIDRTTYKKYQHMPAGPLRTLICESIEENVELAGLGTGDGSPARGGDDAVFAQIRMNSANQCPLLSREWLCRIHRALGRRCLAIRCATYPRIVHRVRRRRRKQHWPCPVRRQRGSCFLSPDLLGADLAGERDTKNRRRLRGRSMWNL